MNVLILAAGYATRLYPLTLNKAKPLLEVAAGRTHPGMQLLEPKWWPHGPPEVAEVPLDLNSARRHGDGGEDPAAPGG